jgi:hypothetical protein
MTTAAMPKASKKTQENLISFLVIRAMAQGRCPEEVVEERSEGGFRPLKVRYQTI